MSKKTKKTLGLVILISLVYGLVFFAFKIEFFPIVYGFILNLFIVFILMVYEKFSKDKVTFSDIRNKKDLEEETRIVLAHYEDLYKKYRDLLIAYEDLDKDLKDFYALWIHEIKTPIAENRLILAEDRPDIDLLIKNNKRIDGFVDILLGFIRGTSKTNDYIFKEVDIENLIKDIIREKSYDFIKKDITLDLKDLSYKTISDKKWLGFIISQALTNSLKYTIEGGKIKIYIKDKSLIIEDNGIGIKRSDLKRIFDMGYTGENGRVYGRSTGLGLYLSKKIAEDLNIGLKIDSKEGEFTKVILKFDKLTKL